MKSLAKLTLALVTLSAMLVLVAPPAAAANYDQLALSYTGIGTTAGGATTTVTNQIIDCTQVKAIAMMARFTFANTTTSNVVFTFYRSLDGTNFETTPGITWTVEGNSTTPVVAAQSVDVSGFSHLKLGSIQNTHASIVLTNEWFKYSVKKNAP